MNKNDKDDIIVAHKYTPLQQIQNKQLQVEIHVQYNGARGEE